MNEETIHKLIPVINEHIKTNPTIGSDDIEQMWAFVNGEPWTKGHTITDVPRYPKNWFGPRSLTGRSIKKLVKSNPFTADSVMVKLTTRFNIPQILSGQGFSSPSEVGEAFLTQWRNVLEKEKQEFPDHRTLLFLFDSTYAKLVLHEKLTQTWNHANYVWEYSDASKRNVHGFRFDGMKMFSIQLNDNRLHRTITLDDRMLIDLQAKTITPAGTPSTTDEEQAKVATLAEIFG